MIVKSSFPQQTSSFLILENSRDKQVWVADTDWRSDASLDYRRLGRSSRFVNACKRLGECGQKFQGLVLKPLHYVHSRVIGDLARLCRSDKGLNRVANRFSPVSSLVKF